ncbi:hypothetical protein JA9_003772 [Meyerozyma sp. JA9]|nr:hypothetical protein JA9_003772 [Meyerozyma sp. JA9]
MLRFGYKAFRGPSAVTSPPSVSIIQNRLLSSSRLYLNNNTPSNADKSKSQAIADVDNLLNETSNFHANSFSNRSKDRMFDISVKHPRDVAKSIRVQGPIAGRSVDVQYGNFARSLSSMFAVVRSNKIRYLKKIQARHIPPAKLRKQKKREWWRRKFSSGFKELMAQVRDAKRRGY